MRWFTMASAAVLAVVALAPGALAQGQTAAITDRGYVGQMTEEQIKQKLAGEGFSQISEVKKIPVTKYRWTAKAMRSGKEMEVTVDEQGHVSAK
jgi:Peptidase propeptide and YPEB domain